MSEKDSNTEMDATEIISDLHNQLHSLRMAVAKFLNEEKVGQYPDNTYMELALSAGIVFENGVWKLKD